MSEKIKISAMHDAEDGYCSGYVAKGHHDLADFMAELRREVDDDDAILEKTPTHKWLRAVRDFGLECTVWIDANPGSRGAFPATVIE